MSDKDKMWDRNAGRIIIKNRNTKEKYRAKKEKKEINMIILP